MDPPVSVLSSFRYANDQPYVVSKKAFESSSKVLKDIDEAVDDDPPTEPAKKDDNKEAKQDDDGIEWSDDELLVKKDDDDDIEWSGDEAELSREISILEQSISSKREHSPVKQSPRKRKPN